MLCLFGLVRPFLQFPAVPVLLVSSMSGRRRRPVSLSELHRRAHPSAVEAVAERRLEFARRAAFEEEQRLRQQARDESQLLLRRRAFARQRNRLTNALVTRLPGSAVRSIYGFVGKPSEDDFIAARRDEVSRLRNADMMADVERMFPQVRRPMLDDDI